MKVKTRSDRYIKRMENESYSMALSSPRGQRGEENVYLVLVLLCENLVVVLVVVCMSLLPQMPPASPIEDRGTAIPIEDRDRAIPERLRLCEPRGGSSSSLQVIASSNGTTKPVVPPASPIEDRGTAIPIEDRDRVIPECLRLCGVIVKGLPVSLMWRKNDSVGL
ncbi:hypothetical protein F2Q70_00038025 [Brassica cretica]|uniref:Uncharacterized protein n=1 Tax=Brassica cretica TaxID=69181 RepID=A0A8S9K8A3_BRACR|nr:hypothetical protein F2Q70_00038025 [Brassica cretica]